MRRVLALPAHAKLNLDLAVLGVLPGGYHELRTRFQAISLHDLLMVEPAASTSLDGGTVVRADALRWLQSAPRFDLALVDPPYQFDAWDEVLGLLRASVLVAESDRAVELGSGWRVVRSRRYGGTVVHLIASE